MNSTPQVFVLKVALMENKRIWRKIAIREDQKLTALHKAIFKAFDRYDEHLYSFFIPEAKIANLRNIYDAPEYSHPAALEDSPQQHNAQKTSIAKLNLKPKQVFYYLFDFGDDWWHQITVDSIQPAGQNRYPMILERKGKSPEQYEEEE
jgi:hypothetical protein